MLRQLNPVPVLSTCLSRLVLTGEDRRPSPPVLRLPKKTPLGLAFGVAPTMPPESH